MELFQILHATTQPTRKLLLTMMASLFLSILSSRKFFTFQRSKPDWGHFRSYAKIWFRASGNLSIKEPAVCALRHLTSRNVYATRARDEVGGSAIIPMVKEALRMPQQMTHAHMGYIRAITSLIRNIAHAPSELKSPLWFHVHTLAPGSGNS